MNKFQKKASKMARYDIKRGVPKKHYKRLKNCYLNIFKNNNYDYFQVLDFERWNKFYFGGNE